jgi:hypothetical protein
MEVDLVKLMTTSEPMSAASVWLSRPGIRVSFAARLGTAVPAGVIGVLLADAHGYGLGTGVRGVTGNDNKFMTVRKQQQRDGIVPGIPPRGDTA